MVWFLSALICRPVILNTEVLNFKFGAKLLRLWFVSVDETFDTNTNTCAVAYKCIVSHDVIKVQCHGLRFPLMIQIGNAVADLRMEAVLLDAVRKAGLEIVEFKNAHYDGDLPW